MFVVFYLRNEGSEKALNIEDYSSCANFRFRSLYLKYFSDLNGHKQVLDYDGPISNFQKNKDVSFLDREYNEWLSFLENKQNGNELINYISQENNHQLKKIKEYCEKASIGSNYQKYLEKSIVLHGKYIYLRVKEFYQELGEKEQIVEINGKLILIDPFPYVHTLFRHYASSIKEHQQDKTYHFDKNLSFKSIPMTLFEIIECYKTLPEKSSFNQKNIYVKIESTFYVIWLRPFTRHLKAGIKVDYLRVQTFYPISEINELNKINSLTEINSNCGFIFLM